MFGKSKDRGPSMDLAVHKEKINVTWALARLAWRYRWQLAPIYVAAGLLIVGWLLAILALTAGPSWTAAAYLVAGICTLAWLSRLRGYDRFFAAVVTVLATVWLVLVTVMPITGALYGIWALATPLLGLGWWMGPALAGHKAAERLAQRWATVSRLADLSGTVLTTARETINGRVLTVKVPGDKSVQEISATRLEAAYELRPGAISIKPDPGNARRAEIHIVDRDPWEADLTHPAVAALAALKSATVLNAKEA